MAAEPLEPAAFARLLEASLAAIEAEIAALGDDGAAWRPAPGEWCANEIVGHLIEAERRGFAGRIRAILAAHNPRLQSWDQPAVAASRHDCDSPPAALVAELRQLRRDSLRLIAGLSPGDLDRAGIHPDVGELRVSDLLAEWVHHDRNHVKQLLANTQARVTPQMGNARRFVEREA